MRDLRKFHKMFPSSVRKEWRIDSFSIVLTEYTITLNTRAEGSTDHAEVLLSSKYLRTLFICEFIRNVISGRVICMQR